MRIRSVQVSGYRSLRDVRFGDSDSDGGQIGPRAVVFGQNAVGKSNLLRILDLLLIRAPRFAQPRGLGLIRVPEEPAAVHLALSTGEASANISLEQPLARVRGVLEAVPREELDVVEQKIIEGLLESIKGKSHARVDLRYAITSTGDDVQLRVERASVDGRVWLEHGNIAHERDDEENDGGELLRAPMVFDRDVLLALTEGFVRVDCPRILQPSERRIAPPMAKLDNPSEQKKEEARRRQFASPWLELRDDQLVNRLHAADRDPTFAKQFDRLRRHLLRDHHGWIGIRSFWENKDEFLDLFLSELPELQRTPGSTPFIPARFRGTGFVQMLYVLAACYLSGASVIGIEELEVNLAPSTQRELWAWLGDQTREEGLLDQVIVTSHSPMFLQGGRENADVDVWYASLDDESGTTLERLRQDRRTQGEEEPVRAKLREHFGPMEQPLWSLEASPWRPPASEDDLLDRLYRGETPFEGPFEEATFLRLLAATSAEPLTDLRIIKGVRLRMHVKNDVPPRLFESLSLEKWARGASEARVLRVEWTEVGTGNAERRIRVEGKQPGDDEEQELILIVEERIRRGHISEGMAAGFWRELLDSMRSRIEELQDKLSGR